MTIIGVTGPDKRLKFGWWATRIILLLCGMRGVYLTAKRSSNRFKLQGVIIGGGDDIDPAHYGESGDAGANYDPERDAFEIQVIRQCIDQRIPLLGICRGAQLINVVLGGSLHSDIRPLRKITPNVNSALPVKWASIESDSLLANRTQSTEIKINSLHHQAIERLGEGLRKVAFDRDGFIQGIESSEGFLTGVQWHPEYMPYKKSQRNLIKTLGKAAQENKGISISIK